MNRIYEKGWLNKFLIALAVAGIALTFLFQEFTFLSNLNISGNAQFILRKVLRVLLNDFFMLIFIAPWFKEWRITRLAIAIQLIDSLIFLPPYFALKLFPDVNPAISIPLLPQLH